MYCNGQGTLQGLKSLSGSSKSDFLAISFKPFNPWRTLLWHSLQRILPLRAKSARLGPLTLVEGFWNEGSFYSNSAVKQIKVRLLSNGQLIYKECRTSTGEKQGRLLSEGARPGPKDVGPLPDWISWKKEERKHWIVDCVGVYVCVLCTNISRTDWQKSVRAMLVW